mgnify:CR=1 FL=1
MMKIEQIKSTPDRAGRYLIRFVDGHTMRLYRQTVEDFGLYPGMELTDEEMENLAYSAGQMSAKMRAVRIISASSVSRSDLQQRLVQKGEDKQQAEQAIAWLEELSLLDDRKTAQQIVSRCISKGYGLSRAKQALYEKRIPKEYWEEALVNYPQQEEAIMAYLSSKLTAESDSKQLRRVMDALIRRGHSYATIKHCLSQLCFDTDELLEG